jgi:collagen type XII alpha
LLVCLDLAFLIDGSISVGGETNFKQIINFVWNVVQAFSVSSYLTRIAVAVFSLESFAIFNFHTYYDKANILQALNTVQYPGTDGPGTYIGRGLHVTRHYLFEETGRPRVPHALIIVAAGRSLDDVISPAMELRSMGIDIYCVGVGNTYSKLQLHAMASFPHSEHIFGASISQLGYIAQNVVTKILKGTNT